MIGIAVGALIHGFVPDAFLADALGTVPAFMMSVVALSLPEMIILRRTMKPRLMAAFIAVGIVLTSYLFNAVL